MKGFLIKAKKLLFDIVFPPLCLNCQKYLENPSDFICGDCRASIRLNTALFCPVCRKRIPDHKLCHSPYLLAAASDYQNPAIQNLIYFFKYKKLEKISEILGEMMIDYLKTIENYELIRQLVDENFSIVSIPLHPSRQRERGFNQSELLTDFISRNLNLKTINVLARIKNNPAQAKTKNREERLKNTENCFVVKNPEAIKGKNIIVIDDVYTSGATMSEAIRTLKQNGAKKIIALVAAKA